MADHSIDGDNARRLSPVDVLARHGRRIYALPAAHPDHDADRLAADGADLCSHARNNFRQTGLDEPKNAGGPVGGGRRRHSQNRWRYGDLRARAGSLRPQPWQNRDAWHRDAGWGAGILRDPWKWR